MFSDILRTLGYSALITVALSSTAYAQDQPNLEDFKEKMAQAAAMVKQDLDEALRQYLEIHVLYSGPEIDYSLGRTYQRMGQCKDALAYYSKIMSYVADTHPIFTRTVSSYDEVASCETWQKIKLSCDMPEGSYIMFDNERINSCWSRPISLPDGEHKFRLISQDGKKEVTQTIVAKSGEPDITVKLAFDKETKEVVKRETVEKSYILKDKFHPALYWGLITGGVAVMGVSGIFYGLAYKSYGDEIKYADLYSSTGEKDYLKKARDARHDVRMNNIITYSILGAGGAIALTGVVLAIVNATSEKERIEVTDDFSASIVPTDGGVAVGMGWRF